MLKKFLLTNILIMLNLATLSYAQAQGVYTQTKGQTEKIAFVLFKLIDSDIIMEKYDTEELSEEITYISKEKSQESIILTLSLREKGLTPRLIQWDQKTPGKMNILAGKGDKTTIYTVDLTTLFTKQIDAICFDCKVIRTCKPENEIESRIEIILPIKLDDIETGIIFTEKIKSACGFLMSNYEFERLIATTGVMKKKEAIRKQIVCPCEESEKENSEEAVITEEQLTEQTKSKFEHVTTKSRSLTAHQKTKADSDIAAEAPLTTTQTTSIETSTIETEESAVASTTETPSRITYIFSRIKDGASYLKDNVIAKMIAIKQILFSLFKKKEKQSA